MDATITNADKDLISAIRSILKFHPSAKMKVSKKDETLHYISKEDEAKLLDTYERNKRGEVKFYTDDELSENLAKKAINGNCLYRKNPILDDESVRDLIFKGYVVPFQIYADKIEILGIYKQNIWKNK